MPISLATAPSEDVSKKQELATPNWQAFQRQNTMKSLTGKRGQLFILQFFHCRARLFL
jgi:hypothetical protein